MPESVGLAWYSTGTVKLTQGSTDVIGVGTNWKNAGLKVGDVFTIDRVTLYMIASVNSNTSITLLQAYAGTSGNTMNYYVIRNFAATLQAELSAQVSQLVGEYESWRDGKVNEIAIPFDFSSLYKGVWATGRSYKALDIVMYNSALYVCLLAHTSASGNTPGTAGANNYWGSYAPAMPAGIDVLNYNNAYAHNSFYRGKNLGSALTAQQSAAIRNGTFEDIYPGDYWSIPVPAYTWTDSDGNVYNEPAQGTRYWHVMGLDYFYKNYVHIQFTSHHVVVVPSHLELLSSRAMNATETTAGGYAGSDMFTKHLKQMEELLKATFGDDHLLRYSMGVCNAVTDGKESGWVTVSNRICDLLTLSMVGVSNPNALFTPLPGFFLNKHEIAGYWAYAWLQDVYDSKDFYVLHNTGGIYHYSAKNPDGYGYIRPFFLLH